MTKICLPRGSFKLSKNDLRDFLGIYTRLKKGYLLNFWGCNFRTRNARHTNSSITRIYIIKTSSYIQNIKKTCIIPDFKKILKVLNQTILDIFLRFWAYFPKSQEPESFQRHNMAQVVMGLNFYVVNQENKIKLIK